MKREKLIIANEKELKDIKQIEVDILSDFHNICKENYLEYFLCGGSCLGAVRHNGFIPWDDDIDIFMSREDYNKFISIYKNVLDNKKYYFQSLEINNDFGWPFGKIRRKNTVYKEWNQNLSDDKAGIWIDIFVYDKIPNNKLITIIQYARVFKYKIMLFRKLGNTTYGNTKIKNFIIKVLFFASKFYSVETLKKRLFKNMTKYNYLEDNYKIISYGGSYLLKEIYDKEWFKEKVLHKFENKKFYIPKEYDKYLSQIYGDYMKLPPKEEQIPKHEVEKIVTLSKGD